MPFGDGLSGLGSAGKAEVGVVVAEVGLRPDREHDAEASALIRIVIAARSVRMDAVETASAWPIEPSISDKAELAAFPS
jgi:hypothetical protein